MLGAIDLFNDPIQQPCLGVPLSEGFLETFGPPALLTVPLSEERAYDWSFNGNHGTLNGGITPTASGWGTLGQSWSLNGTTGNININTLPTIVDNWSVAILFNPAALSGELFSTRGTATDQSFDIQPSATGVHGDIGTGSAWLSTAANGAFSISTGKWYLVIYAVSTTGYTIYANGVQVGSGSWAANHPLLSNATHQLYLGCQNSNGSAPFGGKIAFCGIWTSTFTAAQDSQLYNVLLYGEPFPLFQPQATEQFFGTAVVAAGGPWPWFYDGLQGGRGGLTGGCAA